MIADRLENASLYYPLGERIMRALNFLQNSDLLALETGQHPIEGDDIFAIVNEYDTQVYEDHSLEAHRKYIDVQYVVKGSELMGYCALDQQAPSRDYSDDKDYALYRDEPSFIEMHAGMFAIFFPTDLHMPGMGRVAAPVKKIVVKVRV
ncbi:MAG: YhcH/YjgK/YiaL family protein [Gammaproteobacteria bacterium]|nr:YhcH/YjgK/YiaL family protein [Gammaproteobacteria bacterium]